MRVERDEHGDDRADVRGDGVLSYDLTVRPWIPVQCTDGTEGVLSLLDVFVQARKVRRIVGDLPTQEFALLRLLLAVLHDALDGRPDDTDDWAELWESAEPFDAVPAYLEQHRDRFDLLHPVAPFFQVAELRTGKNEVFALDRIVADVPNGDPFFSMRRPGADRLGFAEAARWVVHAHAYDTSGIKTGAVGDPDAKAGKAYPKGPAWAGNLGGIAAEGRSLRETLLLNLIAPGSGLVHAAKDDAPAWRRPPCAPGENRDPGFASRPSGVRDLYTWQSRRIRLHYDADGVHGVLLSYGDGLVQRNRQKYEPMSAWRRSEPQEKKLREVPVYLPREHKPERAAWRGMQSLVAPVGQGEKTGRNEPAGFLRPALADWLGLLVDEGHIEPAARLRLRTYGVVYGTQQSVIDEITADGVDLSVALLGEQDRLMGQTAVDAVGDADAAVRVLADLAGDLAHAAGAETDRAKKTAGDLGYAALDGPYRIWVSGLAPGVDRHEHREIWQESVFSTVWGLGRRLLDEAGEAAFAGRQFKTSKGTVILDSALADLWFRSRLRRALPAAQSSNGSGAFATGEKSTVG
ncbi:type I-E CRISPR-associated protein Cse1/CasA [Streptomyces indicus]|uniref:CRISPR system Cascade subunit CasA n=1 Tax=Streptomyces indicus TaxID=417292 RepID=A0A1G9BE28_9ACTN|nr:type I-E CRISPR-associated protein Cse1/CasA [Streptomyces indicus]SDK37782.1 CRISPR system Cascade subunit CasA [Streptomyces indicus]